MARLTQSQRYVAFIDILGFRELLADRKFGEKIELLVTALRKRESFDSGRYPYLNYLVVSDSIIIIAEENHSPNLLWKISQIQNALLRIGFATRGGVAFGEVYAQFDTNAVRNIFGKAYVAAYEIERSLAIYPRVVIESNLVEKIRSEFPGVTKYDFEDFVLNDTDGCSFVNQFVRDEVHFKSGSRKLVNKAKKNQSEYLNLVSRGLRITDAKARMKWWWLNGQLIGRLKV